MFFQFYKMKFEIFKEMLVYILDEDYEFSRDLQNIKIHINSLIDIKLGDIV